MQKLFGQGAQASPDLTPSGEGDTHPSTPPHNLGALIIAPWRSTHQTEIVATPLTVCTVTVIILTVRPNKCL